jgi:hypothetical protein
VGKQPYVQLRHIYMNIIKTNLPATGCGNSGWIHLAQKWAQGQALVNMVMNIWVPLMVGKFFTSWAPYSFSRQTQLHGVYFSLQHNFFTLLIICITCNVQSSVYCALNQHSMRRKRWSHNCIVSL